MKKVIISQLFLLLSIITPVLADIPPTDPIPNTTTGDTPIRRAPRRQSRVSVDYIDGNLILSSKVEAEFGILINNVETGEELYYVIFSEGDEVLIPIVLKEGEYVVSVMYGSACIYQTYIEL